MNPKRKTIFLVDDDLINLKAGNDALSKSYAVLTLNSGARLLKILESHIPDLILLDVEMPEMNGYQTIKLIKEKESTRDIPVIFLTAKSESELYGLSLGAVDYIIKPFSQSLLLKRIELHLLLESQKRELIGYNKNLHDMVESKTKTVVEMQNTLLKTMAELVEFRDEITGGHIDRTQNYMRLLIDELLREDLYKNEVSSWDTELVLQSAQLHDVGKIAVKDNILQKPGKLTNEEFEEIKAHAAYGEKLLDKIKQSTDEQSFWEYAKVMAGTHHEKWDGSGYPRGLRYMEIPLPGRLMAIADVYDALVSHRPYKSAFTHKQAIDIIVSEKGTHFDPVLVDLFLNIADKFEEVLEVYS